MLGIQVAAKFTSRLKKLMLQKSVELGYQLTQKELSEKTGLSMPAVSRWYNSEFDRIDADAASRLIKYFDCSLAELVELKQND